MIKRRLIVLVVLLSLMLSPIVVLASDISAAQYYGIIQVSNNSTATTYVATTCNISTQNLIDGDYLNASANNCAIRTSGGGDVVFQPSVNSTYAWSIWEESIGGNTYDTDLLYTAESTGGLIRYFPGAAGMETADSATFEAGDNFTIEQSGWVNTANGTDKNLVYKEGVFEVIISDNVSGNITANIGASDWIRPTGFVEATGNWTLETRAYDGNLTTGASMLHVQDVYNNRLELTHPGVLCDKLRFYTGVNAQVTSVNLTAYYGGAWNVVYTGAFGQAAWQEHAIGSTELVTAMGLSFFCTDAGGPVADWLMEAEFGGTANASVTATEVDSENHTVKVTSELTLDFDGANDFVKILDADQLDGHAEMSLECWVRIDAAGGSAFSWLISKEGVGAIDAYRLWANTTTRLLACMWVGTIGTSTHTTTDNFTLGEWTYVVSTYDGANIRVYIDGVLDGATPAVLGSIKATTADVYLGISYNEVDEELNGSMVEAKIYSRVLTDAEILERSNGYYASETGLVAHYAIDEGTGTNIADSTAYGNDGTASGTSWDDEELKLYIDDVFCDIDALTTVPDTSANWTFCENDSFMWLTSQTIDMGGVERQSIAWEYDSTFTDASGNSNDAVPSFRTASSDADVSATLLSFYPISEAKAPEYVLDEVTPFIDADYLTDNLTPAGGFTTTANTTGGFPLAGVIATVAGATATPTPAQLPLVTLALFVILVVSFCTGYMLRKYGRGSLLVKMLVACAAMGIFVALRNFGWDMWMIYTFVIIAVALGFGSKAISI